MQKKTKKAKLCPNQSWVEILYLLKKRKVKTNNKCKKKSKLCPNESWIEI